MILSLTLFLVIFDRSISSEETSRDRELQLATGVCPLNFLSFSLSFAPKTNSKSLEYETTVVNFGSNFEGDDFYVNDTYIDPEAIKTFDDGTVRKMNKISKQCNFLSRDDYESGSTSHYFEIIDSTTTLIGECESQDNRFKSCAHAASAVTITHDPYFSKGVVIAIILESCKLFMDLNVATPFYHTFLGPYTVTSKFNAVLSGVQPYIMSSSDIQLYEQSLYNISTDFFSNYTTPVVITQVSVLSQKLNVFDLEVETEVLSYYDGELSLKKTISEVVKGISKEGAFVTNLKNNSGNYFQGLVGVANAASGETIKKIDFVGQNITFYIPDMSLTGMASVNDSDEKLKRSTSAAMSLAVLSTFFGIIAVGAMYARYANRHKR